MHITINGLSITVLTKVFSSMSGLVLGDCVFTGGHVVSEGIFSQQVNEGTDLSFRMAVDFFKKAKTNKGSGRVGLGLLVNNIGTTCGGVCYLPADNEQVSNALPEIYLSVLEKLNIQESELMVFYEKHLRNRGKKEFRKRVGKMPGIEKREDGYWLKDEGGRAFMLTRLSSTDPYGTPACPLIMAAFILEHERLGYRNSVNFWYVDSDNVGTIPNYFMIEKGFEVAKMLGARIEVLNIYFTKDKVFTNFVV